MNTPNTPSTPKPLSAAKTPLNFLASPTAGLASESAAMLYASDMLKIFLTDVADRVKTLRRSRHGEPNRVVLQFLTTLSAAPDPVMALEQLQLSPLADFQSFLRTSLQNIAEDFDADRPLQAYQVLTENLNSTSSYLSDVLTEIETQPAIFDAIQSYSGIAEQGRTAAESSRRTASVSAIGRADSKQTADAEAEINADTTPAYHKTFFVKPKTGEDFGFTLGDLFGDDSPSPLSATASQPARAAETHTNGASKSQKPSDTPQPVSEVKPSPEAAPAAEPNIEIEPAIKMESIKPESIKPAAAKAFPVKEFLQILTAKVDSLISVQGKSSVVSMAFNKICYSRDFFTELKTFSFIPDIADFTDFLRTLDAEAIPTLSDLTDSIAPYIINAFEHALENESYAEFIQNYVGLKISRKVSGEALPPATPPVSAPPAQVAAPPEPLQQKMETAPEHQPQAATSAAESEAAESGTHSILDTISDTPIPDEPALAVKENALDELAASLEPSMIPLTAPDATSDTTGLTQDTTAEQVAPAKIAARFATASLVQAKALLAPGEAGLQASQCIVELLNAPDVLATLGRSDIDCLKELRQFLGEVESKSASQPMTQETLQSLSQGVGESLAVELEQHFLRSLGFAAPNDDLDFTSLLAAPAEPKFDEPAAAAPPQATAGVVAAGQDAFLLDEDELNFIPSESIAATADMEPDSAQLDNLHLEDLPAEYQELEVPEISIAPAASVASAETAEPQSLQPAALQADEPPQTVPSTLAATSEDDFSAFFSDELPDDVAVSSPDAATSSAAGDTSAGLTLAAEDAFVDAFADDMVLDESLLLDDSAHDQLADSSKSLLSDLNARTKQDHTHDDALGDTLLDDSADAAARFDDLAPLSAETLSTGSGESILSSADADMSDFFSSAPAETTLQPAIPADAKFTDLHSQDATGLDDGLSAPLLSENESLDDPFTTALDDAFSESAATDGSGVDEFTLDDSGGLDDSAEVAALDVPIAQPQDQRATAKDKPAVKPQRKFEPNEIQKIFLEEASEYLEKLNQDLFALDKNVGAHDAERIGSVLRSSHTIKGSAAMVQLRHISELAHKMEDTLQLVRDNKLKVQRVLIDVLVQATDTISAMLGKFQQTGDDGIEGQENLSKTLLNYADQLKKNGQIAAAGERVMPSEQEAIAEGAESIRQFREKFVSTVAEQTVRIDITTLNNLVNLSAELVIARNRLSTELSIVYKTINKFIKERGQLTQFSKKLNTTIQKQTGGKLGTGEGNTRFGDVLSEFSDTEFDRFSEFDILSRDIKSAMLNFDEAIKDMRTNTSTLNQNIVRVSGIANDLNREIVSMRMVPVKQMFTRFNRSLRDIAKQESKELNLITEGEDTKLDKTVMEEVIEPVMHLVRNSIGHGIETPDIRMAQGKPPAGTLTMRAYQKGNQIILEVQDDGAGLNIDRIKQKAVQKGLITEAESLMMPAAEATELIFRAGFSTADQVTELQGRGVGMDVVRSTIRRLKGSVNVESAKGKGTKFIISLPLTLAIGNALLVEVMAFTYAMPLDIVLETANISTDTIEQIEDKRYITIRGEKIELRYLNDILGYESDALLFRAKLPVVVIEMDDQKVAVGVERLLGKEEIVVKTLGKHLRNVRGITGSTILGDGQVVIILDFNYLLKSAAQKEKDIYVKIEAVEADVAAEETAVVMPEATKRKRKGQKITVLAADDSPSVRKYIQSVLQQADINVVSADDGLNAPNKLAAANADIVVTDLEMPRMNGFELVSEIRKLPQYDDLPIVIVTARAGEKHRRTGLELGASAFLNKPFDPRQLIETIESFVA